MRQGYRLVTSPFPPLGRGPDGDAHVNTPARLVTPVSGCALFNSVYNSVPSPGSQDPNDLAVLAGLRVEDNDDDDPVLLWPDGTPVDTWRKDYPYSERMTRDYYDRHKRLLQI